MKMRALFTGLLIAALPLVVNAGQAPETTAFMSWTAPTQFTDGSAMSKCASQTATGNCLRSYRVYHGLSATSLTESRDVNDRNALSYDWTGLAPGTHYFAVTALTGNGTESSLSTIGSKVVPNPFPMPPGNFTVQQQTAYYVIQQENRFVLLPAGTVPNGTACDGTQQVNGHSAVPRSAVTWFGTVRPLVVVAQCG